MKKNIFHGNGKLLTAVAGLSLVGNGYQAAASRDNHPEIILEEVLGSRQYVTECGRVSASM